MTKLPNDAAPPRVFLSYSHDTPEHAARVLELADRLRAEGIDAWIDQYVAAPPEGWPEWCERQVEEADFVLVVCTETYLARFRKKAPPGVGLGVKWEGHVITTELYESEGRNAKFVPVLLGEEPVSSIPQTLRSTTRYQLPRGYEQLYRRLTDQPEVRVPTLGTLRPMPPRGRSSLLFDASPLEQEPSVYPEGGTTAETTRQARKPEAGGSDALSSASSVSSEIPITAQGDESGKRPGPSGRGARKKPWWLPFALPGALLGAIAVLGFGLWSVSQFTGGPEVRIEQGAPPSEVTQPAATVLAGTEPPQGPFEPAQEWLHEPSGQVLVYVPGGEYRQGEELPYELVAESVQQGLWKKDDAERWLSNSLPVHTVTLSPFWVGKHPVTNERYRRFLEANPGAQKPEEWTNDDFNQPEQPVVGVSWDEAVAYCQWAGMELPSEAQWEAAARGTDGRRYPWGNEKPTKERANFSDKVGRTTSVGAYPAGAGPFGTLDQAGNVWEWCADVWNPLAYEDRNGSFDPIVRQGNTAIRPLRGGSWNYRPWNLQAAARFRYWTDGQYLSVGFRSLCLARPEP